MSFSCFPYNREPGMVCLEHSWSLQTSLQSVFSSSGPPQSPWGPQQPVGSCSLALEVGDNLNFFLGAQLRASLLNTASCSEAVDSHIRITADLWIAVSAEGFDCEGVNVKNFQSSSFSAFVPYENIISPHSIFFFFFPLPVQLNLF